MRLNRASPALEFFCGDKFHGFDPYKCKKILICEQIEQNFFNFSEKFYEKNLFWTVKEVELHTLPLFPLDIGFVKGSE